MFGTLGLQLLLGLITSHGVVRTTVGDEELHQDGKQDGKISLRLPMEFIDAVDYGMKQTGLSSRSDFIRRALIHYLILLGIPLEDLGIERPSLVGEYIAVDRALSELMENLMKLGLWQDRAALINDALRHYLTTVDVKAMKDSVVQLKSLL